MRSRMAALFVGLLCQAGAREVPVPLADHPGNVWLEGEKVAVALPESFKVGMRWELRDAEGRRVAGGACEKGKRSVEAGALPLGWYRVDGLDGAGRCCAWTTAAVLKRLAAPVPQSSPVCIDTANAWFTRTGNPEGDLKKMAAFASLAALAGVNGARDRLTWGELEPSAGAFSGHTRYDDSARILGAAGLDVLQVFHGTPGWAQEPRMESGEAGKRYPRDLRDQFRFCRAMARRFKGTIQAWEPWNEANIPGFGGQLIDEMCALQKAAFLGFKAGDPGLTVCWNVYAGPGSKLHTQGVIDSACWPYFDTYNIHSYSRPEQYPNEFATARAGACGKPLWISECGVHVRWEGEYGDLPESEEIRQARFVPESYATSLFSGVARHYFFILGNYRESQVQFGLLRHDLTPRRGYLALAAVGRLLAGAQPLGRMTNGALRVYAFQAQPDGVSRDVLVAWSHAGRASLADVLGAGKPEAVFDNYGRKLSAVPESVDEAPVFIVLAAGSGGAKTNDSSAKPRPPASTPIRRVEGEAAPSRPQTDANGLVLTPLGTGALQLEPPLRVAPAPRAVAASSVVMQVLLPQEQTQLDTQAHQIPFGAETTVPVAAYNFGDEPVCGTLRADAPPASWRLTLPVDRVCLRPMERQVFAVKVLVSSEAGRSALFGSELSLRAAFKRGGESVLAFRLACEAASVRPSQETPIASAARAGAWTDNITGGAKMSHAEEGGRVVFTMDFGSQDPWGYPRLKLEAGERPPEGADGLMAEVEVLEGQGTLRAQFLEAGGSAYLGVLPYSMKKRGRQTVTVLFEQAGCGSHSRPDPDGKLTPGALDGLMIGINAQKNSRVRLAVGAVRWIKY